MENIDNMLEYLYPTFVYFLSFVTLFLWLYVKKYSLVPLYIVGIWCVSSFFAILFQLAYDVKYEKLSILPYVFLFICFCISLFQIVKCQKRMENTIPCMTFSLFDKIIWVFVLLSLIPFYENMRYVISSYGAIDTSGLADMYNDKMYGDGIKVTWLSSLGMIGNSLDGIFIQLLVFIPFYFLTREKINKYLLLFSFLPVLNHVLFQLASSGRGFATQFLLDAVFLILLFRKQIPSTRLKKLKLVSLVVIPCFFLLLSILTLARGNSSNKGVETSITVGYYVAKSHLDFNESLWTIRKHTEGDNSFGFVKNLIGLDVPVDKNSYWNYSKTGIIPSLFYTYIGDWYMDFGAIITIILFIIWSFVSLKIFTRVKTSATLLPFFMYFVFCEILINGWSMNIFKTSGSFRNLLFSIFLLIIIQKLSKKGNICVRKTEKQG